MKMMKMYARVVAAVIMVGIVMGMLVEADGHLQQQQQQRQGSSAVRPRGHSSPMDSSLGSPSRQEQQRQAQETSSTMEPTTSDAVMMDPPIDGQDAAEDTEAEPEVVDDADAVDAADADAVMMDPPISTSNDTIAWEESASQGPVTSGMVDVVVPVQDSYDYTNYQGLLNSQWPAMTETCVNGKHEFDPLTQKRVYTVGVQATAGTDAAWQEYNMTFITYLNTVVGPRFDPPIQFDMEVTTRPLHHWVSEVESDLCGTELEQQSVVHNVIAYVLLDFCAPRTHSLSLSLSLSVHTQHTHLSQFYSFVVAVLFPAPFFSLVDR
jgi:hypothetical protein